MEDSRMSRGLLTVPGAAFVRRTISATLPMDQPLQNVDPSLLYEAAETGSRFTHADTLGWAMGPLPSSHDDSLMDESNAGVPWVDHDNEGGSTRDSLGTRVFS